MNPREQAALLVNRADELRARAATFDRRAVKILRDAGIEPPRSYTRHISG